MERIAVLVSGLLLVAAPAGAQTTEGTCTGSAPDSTWLAQGAVYRDCDVDTPAKQRGGDPRVENTRFIGLRTGNSCLRIRLEMVVDARGRVDRDLVRVVHSDHLVVTEEVQKTLGGLRFDPALRGGEPVRQLVVYSRGISVGRISFVVGPAGGGRRPQPPMESC